MDLREQLNTTLGSGYSVERELGGGGMSRVFLAHDKRLDRRIVVKILPPELGAGISGERFEREIRLAASLQQANIVPVLSAGDMSGIPFYMMPFVEGRSLRERLSSGAPLSITEAVRILGDVARALSFAHERGIVHRDIKPDNVLLSGGTAVVTDFGIAKALASSARDDGNGTGAITQLGTAMGTPAYMSPEQAAGDPATDHRTDIYAFGCMAYELLTGQPPFSGMPPQRVMAAHMTQPVRDVRELRSDTPAVLADLVMRCLAKDADDRPGSAAEVVESLDSVATGSGSAAFTTLPPRSSFGRAIAIYVGVVLLLVALARVAVVALGLPDWVFTGTVIVLALGLPAMLATGYVHYVTRRAVTSTPQLTPGGSRAAPHGTMGSLALKASPHLSWRRTALAGAVSLGLFVAVAAAVLVAGTFGVGPAASLLSRGSLADDERLLLADVRPIGVDTSTANVVTEAVRSNLAESGAVRLASAASVASTLGRMNLESSTRVTLPVAREVAQRQGIRAVLDGDVTGVGGGYVIALRLVSADSARELTAVRASVASAADLIEAIDDLSRRLRGRIGESVRTVRASPPLAQVTTTSLPALRKFTEAVRANRFGDFLRAVQLAREAVEIDTTFAAAWMQLGVSGVNGSARQPRSVVDSALSRAYRFRDRLSERGRENIVALYHREGRGRDRARALQAYEALYHRDSSPSRANSLALVLITRREWPRAESLFTWAVRADSSFALGHGNVVIPLFNQGKVREADSMLSLARRRHPGYVSGHVLSVTMLYHRGEFDGYRRGLDSLSRSSSTRARVDAAYGLAWLDLRAGRLSEFERRLANARRVDSAAGRVVPPVIDTLRFAYIDLLHREDPERATRRTDAVLGSAAFAQMPLSDRPWFDVATIYARAGHPDRARRIVREFTASEDTALVRAMQPQVHGALGEIALAEGKPDVAISEFRRADSLPDGPATRVPLTLFMTLSRAWAASGNVDSTIVHLERYRDTPVWDRWDGDWDPLHLAWVHYRLGELYEQRGQHAKADDAYSRFVELWQNADPELQPRVAKARAALARLRGRAG